MELVLKPRLDLVKWATLTKQTPNMKIGYPGQHLAIARDRRRRRTNGRPGT